MPTQSTSFVVILGIATVFIGLIGLVILCKILSVLCNISDQKSKSNNSVSTATQTVNTTNSPVSNNQIIENRQEIIAAVSAALAEELGTDVSAIRILSFKKI